MTTSHPTFPPFSIDDARAEVPVELITYGDDADQVIELYGNSSATNRTVVLIHGGYWRNIFDREHLRPLGVRQGLAGRSARAHQRHPLIHGSAAQGRPDTGWFDVPGPVRGLGG